MKFKSPDDFSDSSPLGALLFIFNKNHHKYLNNQLSKYGLNILQGLFMLRIYYSDDNLTQNDLADTFYLTKGTVAKSLKKLEKDGFIIRNRLDYDKRRYDIHLSKKGKDIIPVLKFINNEWEEKMGLEYLNPEFLETFKDLTSQSINLNQ